MKRIVAVFALTAFAVLTGLGFVSVTQQMQSGHMEGCPFMPGEQATCLMTALDHFNAWQSILSAIVSLAPLVAVFLIVRWTNRRHDLDGERRPPNLARVRNLRSGVPPPFLETLFSNGLLNPRIP